MRPSLPFRAAALVAAAVFVSAPALAAVRPVAPVEVARLACTALVRAHSLACAPVGEGAPGAAALDAPSARAEGGAWTADVRVRNLTARTWGEPDGAGASGVAVVLGAPVTTLGTGTVGAPDAAALRYDATLAPGAATAARPWAFAVPEGVEAFTFTASVLATVSYPRGILTLTPNPVVLAPAGTQALAASARTRTGAVVPSGLVGFTSSNTAIATVGTDGTVTGVAPGLATVTASAGGVSGTAPVCIDPGLAVGGVYHFTLTGGQAICLGGGASGNAEYTLMPMNQTAASVSLSMTGSGIVAVTGPPTPLAEEGTIEEGRPARPVRLLPDGTMTDEPAPGETALDLDAMDAAELARITRDNAELTPLIARPDTRIAAGRAPVAGGGGDHIIPPGVPAVGDLWSLNVAQGCSGAVDNRIGRVLALSPHFIVVQDTLNPPGGNFPYVEGSGAQTSADSLVARAERIAWNPVTAAFGLPTDLDTNQRIVLFFTRAVNELSPPASSIVTFGYSTSRDLFSSDPVSGCQRSNEGEIFYMLVPDPTGAVNSNVRTVSQVVGAVYRTIGRELYRVTNNSRRLYVTEASVFEEPWLDTGLANMAEELMFYGQSVGLTPRQNIVVTQLTTGPNASRRVAAFNAYANLNYGRFRSWLQRPDTSGVYARTGLANDQGSTWSFLRYAVDRRVNAGGGSESAFWTSLIGTTPGSSRQGLDNLRAALGLATEADVLAWVRDWTVAMYTDDAVAGIAPAYTNPSWNYRSIYIALNTSYQLVPRNLTNDVALTLSYRRKGGTAYMRAGVPTGTFATFSAGPALTATLPFSVVRTK